MNSNHFDQDEGFTPDEDDLDNRPSKSARKRAMHELQDLGEQLIAMPADRLADIDMPERLRDALEAWKTTRSHEGRRRQMQYIGKVLRSVDEAPIREAVASFQLGHARDSLALHEAERWRAELIADEKATLTRWVETYPDTDLQQLRALIRNAKKDASAAPEQRSGKGFRELFQFVKKAVEAKRKLEKDQSASNQPGEDEAGA